MKVRSVRDLGQLAGDVWVMGGSVSNIDALRAFDSLLPSGAPVVCTGDTVAYCAAAAETVALIRERNWHVIAGNVERQLAAGLDDCGCGFGDGTACDLLSRGWYSHTDREIGPGDRAWMADLPDIAVFENRGRRYGVVHGGVTAINRFIWPTSEEEVFAEEVEALTSLAGPLDAVISGHSGIAFTRRVASLDWINAGSLGMPANDGTCETVYMVLSGNGPEIRRLTYSAQDAHDRMMAAGLTQGYHTALLTGVWPSQDVLPESLRQVSAP